MKRQFLIVVSFMVLLSCSTSRNVNRDKTEIKTDSLAVGLKKTDSVNIKTIDINYVFNINEMTLKPIDNTKPMVIGGKKFENTVIETKSHTITNKTKIKDSTALKKSDSTKVSLIKDIALNIKKTTSESEGFVLKYIAIGIAVILSIYLLIYLYNKKNPSN